MIRPRLESLLRHRSARNPITRTVRDAAKESDARVWLVGGYVRDAALGRCSPDIDLIAGRGSADLVALLKKRWSTGAFRFRKRGVTTWRFTVGADRVDIVDAARRGLDVDLARRDFTINAVAFDLLDNVLIDPTRGLPDLRARLLRMPRPGVIGEDPLRAVRAARFLAQLPDFRLDFLARQEAAGVEGRITRVATERIREELNKLLGSDDPRRGLETLDELGLMMRLFPELAPMPECVAGQGRPDVWRHTLDAIDLSARRRRLPGGQPASDPRNRALLRWALLLHDVSKPETFDVRDDGRPTFHGHEVQGSRKADEILRRFRTSRDDRRRICRLVLNHLRPGHLADADAPPRGMRRLVREMQDDLPLLVRHAACDALASGSPDGAARWRRLRAVLDELMELWSKRPGKPLACLVDGRTLMRVLKLEAGPRIGEILARIRDEQEAGTIRTRAQALAAARRFALD